MNEDIPSSGENQTPQNDEVPPDLFTVRIVVSRENLTELVQNFPLDFGCRPHVETNPDGTGTLEAYATEESIRAIKAAGYTVEQGENVSALARERQKEVGAGDRFQGGRIAPHGLGRKPGREGEEQR